MGNIALSLPHGPEEEASLPNPFPHMLVLISLFCYVANHSSYLQDKWTGACKGMHGLELASKDAKNRVSYFLRGLLRGCHLWGMPVSPCLSALIAFSLT